MWDKKVIIAYKLGQNGPSYLYFQITWPCNNLTALKKLKYALCIFPIFIEAVLHYLGFRIFCYSIKYLIIIIYSLTFTHVQD